MNSACVAVKCLVVINTGEKDSTRSLEFGLICRNDHKRITDHLQRNNTTKDHVIVYSDAQIIRACSELGFPIETDAQIEYNRANNDHRTNIYWTEEEKDALIKALSVYEKNSGAY